MKPSSKPKSLSVWVAVHPWETKIMAWTTTIRRWHTIQTLRENGFQWPTKEGITIRRATLVLDPVKRSK